ncbi:hypothetical protein GGS21DRAFT_114506 [Xylaria nigripes]|nr:hypothetical protein GGS21DRAFT_114506 [Xylaria nigripes]
MILCLVFLEGGRLFWCRRFVVYIFAFLSFETLRVFSPFPFFFFSFPFSLSLSLSFFTFFLGWFGFRFGCERKEKKGGGDCDNTVVRCFTSLFIDRSLASRS